MNDIEVSSIDLVEGGNVFKQGHYLTLGYVPRDEKGETVDLSGKTLNVSLWGRKGVVFEAAATYSGGVIRFTFDKLVAAGDYTVEFTATSSTDAKYRKKFPTNQHSGRIAIKQSADDLGVVGIQVYTVAQLKAEQKALLDAAVSGFTVDSETKMARVSGTTTHPTIGARLEADKQETAQQLAEKAVKTEVRKNTDSQPINVSEMDTETKALFTGGAVAVVGLNSTGEENLKEKAVTAEKTDFLARGKNLINPATFTPGLLSYTSGSTVASESYQTSDFIYITPNADYTENFSGVTCFYDDKKIFISGVARAYPYAVRNFKTPTNAKFIRVSIQTASLPTYQIESGLFATAYESFRYKIDTLKMDIKSEDLPLIPADKLPVIPDNKITFIQKGKNLLDTTLFVRGIMQISSGNMVASTSYKATPDFVPVKPGTSYTQNYPGDLVFYDANKKLISGMARLTTLENRTFTTPVNCYFIKTSIHDNQQTLYQIEEGTEYTGHQPYSLLIPELRINATQINDFESTETEPVGITLPPKLEAITGMEINVYFDNIISGYHDDYFFDVTCDIGKQQVERWTATPTAAGTFNLTIAIYDKKTYKELDSATTTVNVKSSNVGAGVSKKALFFGSSTTASGVYTHKLLELFETDGMGIELIGTKGDAANKHEGQGGWTYAMFNSVGSPFVFNGAFNFGEYLTANALPVPDYVIFQSGINDIFSAKTDEALKILNDIAVGHMENMISGIKGQYPAMKIGVILSYPLGTQDGFGLNYANNYTAWRYKRNGFLAVGEMLNNLEGRESNGVYVVPVHANIDTRNNMPTEEVEANARNTKLITRSSNGIHMGDGGYAQFADSVFYWLKSFEV